MMKNILIVFLLSVVVAGCASSYADRAKNDMGFVSYYDFVYPPKSPNHIIELYYKDNKPHDEYMVLGKIDAFIEKDTDINPLLQEKARQSGGDAVINITAELVQMESSSSVSTSIGYGSRHSHGYGYYGVTPHQTIEYDNVYKVSAEVVRFDIKKAIID